MTTLGIKQAQNDFSKIIDEVNAGFNPVSVTSEAGKSCVIIGADDWESIQETIYLNSIAGMADSLQKARETPLDECLDESEVEW